MRKEINLVILSLILLRATVSFGNYEILLKSRQFTPKTGISADTTAAIQSIPGKAHVLIQLHQIPTIEERRELERQGVKLLSYIPNNAWFASIPSDKAEKIATLSNVRAVSEIMPEDKICPHIIMGQFFWKRVKDGKADFIVQFFKDVSLEEADLVVNKHKAQVVGKVAALNGLVITARIEESIDLALEEGVVWIEQELPLEPLNDGVRAAIGVDIVQDQPYNLSGNGINVLIYDGGLIDSTHDDFGNRVILGENGSIIAHATHVAGTVGGDGTLSGGTYRGMAPEVDIISYYVSGTCLPWLEPPVCLYSDSGQMADMNDNFQQGITVYGADIGTASVGCQPACWGISCEYEGDYCPYAQLIDTIVYNRSIPITWAAGNERGCETCGTTYYTISPTSTGKNAIIVGAIYSDTDGMTCFSSWGPVDDGRIKPDIVAPGDEALDNPSTLCNYGDKIRSTVPVDTYYEMAGTSMATPAVAGSVALMIEQWREIHPGEPNVLPSTIKAILIQTAKPLPLGDGRPDYSYGYGRVDVKKAIDFIIDGNNVIEDSIIDHNEKDTFYIDVPEGQEELLVTLVWDDFPGDPAAAKSLVNDLDLIVKDPSGRRFYPWTLDPNNPERRAVRTQEDHTNNVEQVWVCHPSPGTWTIEIYGFGIPESPQTYSLVYSWSEIAEHSSRVFSIKNSSGESVDWFDDCGNCWIEGILAEMSSHQPEIYHDEFIFQDSTGWCYMIIDSSDGNMYIYGALYDEYEESLEDSPQTNEFIIKDDRGDIVVLIGDDNGDLYLKGKFLGQVE